MTSEPTTADIIRANAPPSVIAMVGPTNGRSDPQVDLLLEALTNSAALPTTTERRNAAWAIMNAVSSKTTDTLYGSLGLGSRAESTLDERRNRIVEHVATHGAIRLAAPRGKRFSDSELLAIAGQASGILSQGHPDVAAALLLALPLEGQPMPHRRIMELLRLPGRHLLRDGTKPELVDTLIRHLKHHGPDPLPLPPRSPNAEARERLPGRHMSNTLSFFAELPEAERQRLLETRIRPKVRELPSGCWEWTGRTTQYGYGALDLLGHQQLQAHRVALVLSTGLPILQTVVRHLCEGTPGSAGRRCVRPEHLTQATQAENMEDRRTVSDELALLVVERARAAYPTHPWKKIGDEFGISAQTAADISYGRKRYRSVPGLVPIPEPLPRNKRVEATPKNSWWGNSGSGVSDYLERNSQDSSDGCRLWTGVHAPAGYGVANIRVEDEDGVRKSMSLMAHVAAWSLSNRRLPGEGYSLDHTCRNRGCIRPEHLAEVPFAENPRRAIRREGKDNSSARLTPEQVRMIRERYSNDLLLDLRDLAKECGVSRPSIRAIVTGETWSSAGGPLLSKSALKERGRRSRQARLAARTAG